VSTLYRAPWSTNVQRVLMALDHKGLSADEEVVIGYEDRSPVEAVSGQGLVPVFVTDGGDVVADSMAIVARLEADHPDPPLYPADPARRAELHVFVDWFNRVWKVAPNAIEAELETTAPDAARIAARAAAMDEHLDLLEALLDDRAFLFGAFSAADCCAYPFLKYAAWRDPADDERFHLILDEHQSVAGRPRLAAWIERLDAIAPSAA
jgi:glutathione S-transferase